jgi:hypothetical protein
MKVSARIAFIDDFRIFGQSLFELGIFQGIGTFSPTVYKTCICSKSPNSKKLCPKILKFSVKAILAETFIQAKSQVEMRRYDFLGKSGCCRGKCTKYSISRQEQANGMNPFRVSIYTMSLTYEQNMSSNGVYQLVRFPREFYSYTHSLCCCPASR